MECLAWLACRDIVASQLRPGNSNNSLDSELRPAAGGEDQPNGQEGVEQQAAVARRVRLSKVTPASPFA